HRVARGARTADGVTQDRRRSDAADRWVAGREEEPDVAQRGRAEDGVRDRVQDGVAVGVAGERRHAGEAHAAEHQLAAVREAMDVVAVADAQRRRGHALLRALAGGAAQELAQLLAALAEALL